MHSMKWGEADMEAVQQEKEGIQGYEQNEAHPIWPVWPDERAIF